MSLLVEKYPPKFASVNGARSHSDHVEERTSALDASGVTGESHAKSHSEDYRQDLHQLYQVVMHKGAAPELRPAPSEMGGSVLFEQPLELQRGLESSNGSDGDIIRGKLSLYGFGIEKREADHLGTGSVDVVDIPRIRLFDAPLQSLKGNITEKYWDNLTRRLNGSSLSLTKEDPKVRTADPRPRIYVPHGAREQYKYYLNMANDKPQLRLEVLQLPAGPLTPEVIRDMNGKPGVLALAMENMADDKGEQSVQPLPFVVPGGRFNEMYGWDTYFTILGLLVGGKVDICEAMVKNFCFCIQHYGKILNANRSYYLGRSQPPFLTAMGIAVVNKMAKGSRRALALITLTVLAAMKEYHTVWMSALRYDSDTGLSKYQGEGQGFPPEVEPSHFDEVIAVYALKHDMVPADFVKAYNSADLKDADLDEYLRHDRASRESGHDTTYRFVDRGADLATVDLNSCLYKIECDVADILDTYFDGELKVPVEWQVSEAHKVEKASDWKRRAADRQMAMNTYLWCPEEGRYYDYDAKQKAPFRYECATTFWPLWAGAASSAQAESLVSRVLPKLECHGGLVSSTETSRGPISPLRPLRQWDYPYGWAPHQMLAWDGLRKYGYHSDAERLVYRWLSMILKSYNDNNGVVVEKYDVTKQTEAHLVEAEYGNQGSDFDSKVWTGFGWTNASFVYGVSMLEAAADAGFEGLVGHAERGVLS